LQDVDFELNPLSLELPEQGKEARPFGLQVLFLVSPVFNASFQAVF
jgi:hypothetical protein